MAAPNEPQPQETRDSLWTKKSKKVTQTRFKRILTDTLGEVDATARLQATKSVAETVAELREESIPQNATLDNYVTFIAAAAEEDDRIWEMSRQVLESSRTEWREESARRQREPSPIPAAPAGRPHRPQAIAAVKAVAKRAVGEEGSVQVVPAAPSPKQGHQEDAGCQHESQESEKPEQEDAESQEQRDDEEEVPKIQRGFASLSVLMEPRAWDAALGNGQTIADLQCAGTALRNTFAWSKLPRRGEQAYAGSRRVVGRELRSVQHSPHRLDATGICASTNTRCITRAAIPVPSNTVGGGNAKSLEARTKQSQDNSIIAKHARTRQGTRERSKHPVRDLEGSSSRGTRQDQSCKGRSKKRRVKVISERTLTRKSDNTWVRETILDRRRENFLCRAVKGYKAGDGITEKHWQRLSAWEMPVRHANSGADLVDALENRRKEKQVMWSTVDTWIGCTVSMCKKMFKEVLLDAMFYDYARYVTKQKFSEASHYANPASPQDVHSAIQTALAAGDLGGAAFLVVTWATAARGTDTLRLKASHIDVSNSHLACLWTEGKGVWARKS